MTLRFDPHGGALKAVHLSRERMAAAKRKAVCLPVTLAVCGPGLIQSALGLPGRGTLGRLEAGAGPPPLEGCLHDSHDSRDSPVTV